MSKNLLNRRSLALAVIFCLLLNLMGLAALPAAADAGGNYTARDLAAKAIDFIQQEYAAGEIIDAYTAYVLSLAGEDIAAAKWSKNGESLKDKITGAAALFGNSNSLITYILATQNSDGSFGPLANEYGTKAPLQALALIKNDLPAEEVARTRVEDSIARAIGYYQDSYRQGLTTYGAGGFGFDYRCVAALAEAGEDLSLVEWVYGGLSLSEAAIDSAAAAAINATSLDAVYLAKELTVLHAVYPHSEDIDTLAGAIISKQKTDGDQLYFGNSIYDDVLVLTALGRAGKLAGVDQQKALNYLNEFKSDHQDCWGQAAGCAWGGWDPKEPDLTAQVLTALSYFDNARVESSEVYRAIQDGLAYLQDIQDVETGAITHQWDSTFATAETLIALKALGKSYADYGGSGSPWVKKSKTKTVAQSLMALNKWGDSHRANKLAELLAARHSATSFEDSVYSDMWAYLALGEAGQIESVAEEGRVYLLGKQSVAEGVYGSWGDTFGDAYYPDFMSTAQAIRALAYLPGYDQDETVQAAITNGLAYLQSHQQADGSVNVTLPWPEDPVVDTAEVIITLNKLGLDPAAWKNERGLTPVSYMMDGALNGDGSFGSCKNVLGATEALYAYLLLGAAEGGGQSGGGSSGGSVKEHCTVEMAVVGINGEVLYGPSSISISKADPLGLTVLAALEASGISYTHVGDLVTEISGQVNSGMSGWMYKVNGTIAAVAASKKSVRDGDRIIWWYSTDINSSGPTWSEILKGNTAVQPQNTVPLNLEEQNWQLPPDLQVSPEVLSALENIEELLGLSENRGTSLAFDRNNAWVAVVNSDRALSRSQWRAMSAELAAAVNEVSQEVKAEEGAIVSDSGRIALSIPASALKRDMRITIKARHVLSGANEQDDVYNSLPAGQQPVAGYQLGPEGTQFSSPVTLSLKISLPPLVRPQDLTLARYDKSKKQWVPIAAVFDVSRGMLLARITHFSDFAVFAGETRKSFSDVSDTSFGWAKNVIETLAGAGIIAGVDEQRFEPSRAVTRAEFVCLLLRALELEEKAGAENPFKDLKIGDWYAGAVIAAFEAGLVKGYEDGTFDPGNTITREEVVAILIRALELPLTEEEITFKDAEQVSSWARSSVAAAAGSGLTKGFADGTFRPRAATSRAECAGLIHRMIVELL